MDLSALLQMFQQGNQGMNMPPDIKNMVQERMAGMQNPGGNPGAGNMPSFANIMQQLGGAGGMGMGGMGGGMGMGMDQRINQFMQNHPNIDQDRMQQILQQFMERRQSMQPNQQQMMPQQMMPQMPQMPRQIMPQNPVPPVMGGGMRAMPRAMPAMTPQMMMMMRNRMGR